MHSYAKTILTLMGEILISVQKIYPGRSIPFYFCRNFLDLIIFIDENIMCDKVSPKSRARFRELADKYRRLKNNHPAIYWILNNV